MGSTQTSMATLSTSARNSNATLSVRTYIGDAKTLLAFDLADQKSATNLAGFTIQVQAGSTPPYYILNQLQFKTPSDHAQDANLPPNSSFNAPIHKFRWLHVPGSAHQGTTPLFGAYTYTVTPRYFDAKGSLRPLDTSLSVTVMTQVQPFSRGHVQLGFTRGFTQSQAFVHHFGPKVSIQPAKAALQFDTGAQAGVSPAGSPYTYRDEYAWLGFTARERVFSVINGVVNDKSLSLDVFAYDLNEPDLIARLLQLAQEGRTRVILDNASLHHGTAVSGKAKAEDAFEELFTKAATGNAAILRGKFARFSHDKVFIVKSGRQPDTAIRVLTGSTNFSLTGLYVNSNHVIVFDDPAIARQYAAVFDEAWNDRVNAGAFSKTPLSAQTFSFASEGLPPIDVSFSPHRAPVATNLLNAIAKRISDEGQKSAGGSVLFAVMELDGGESPVWTALKAVHADAKIFSYGISDNPGGICLYRPGSNTGVLVTGKPVNTVLPPPFDQVPNIGGVSHQVHHKFVVCGFGGADAVVYCGSSNLASGGEVDNGDNLLAIHDGDVATVFGIEALALVDHFDFLDRTANGPENKNKDTKPKPPASKPQAAVDAGWFLSTDDQWVKPYFDPNDLHCVDRQLFA
jgi:hypothetical protein